MLGRVADVNIHRSQALAEVQFRHLPLLKITKKCKKINSVFCLCFFKSRTFILNVHTWRIRSYTYAQFYKTNN